jgi:valyl-tRNA synthetase
MELPKNYCPESVEDRIFKMWMEEGHFHCEPNSNLEPFTIVIPPPNVTGVLHMGHALNNTIQDILIRKARLDGKNVKWVVGTDHAGIATQNVVERKLKQEGKTRHDVGREKFLETVWAWKKEHGDTIISQLKKMGCSCDYSQERFTLDPGLANAVKICFVTLFEKNLIYRGDRMIHWCPRCLTALADEEAEHHEIQGNLWTLQYPFVEGSGFVSVATTRPETLLGDTAVAVNPQDLRFAHWIGKKVRVPFVEREIPIIADAFVDPKFGTGMVKVTPAHDPNDYDMGTRHSLPLVNVMTDAGMMNENAGPYQGMDRFACRKKIVADLKERGQLEKIESHAMAIRKCYRCDTIVEPKVSKQWFVKMKPLADRALEDFQKGGLQFYPERFRNIYTHWLENIKDWCISRQIWWGHQIPAWHCTQCSALTVTIEHNPSACSHCGHSALQQDPDVLDTWFSSWLWPFSTLGWPEQTKDLQYFYPTHILATAQEIIFFWVARMVMAGFEFTGRSPFKEVYIHGTVRDESGRKMSKSLGNVIDPLKIIKDFGADALRFSLMVVASRGNDVFLSDKKFEIGRNFATKIWNAFRFLWIYLGEQKINTHDYQKFAPLFSNDDRLILRKTEELLFETHHSIAEFRFNDTALTLYDFFWKSFCDRYIESTKFILQQEGRSEDKNRILAILLHVLSRFLIAAHPIIPFITEELWQILRTIDPLLPSLLATSQYPQCSELPPTSPAILFTEQKYELITAIRHLKKNLNLPNSAEVSLIIQAEPAQKYFLESEKISIQKLARVSKIELVEQFMPSRALPSEVTPLGTLFLELSKETMDLEGEKKRIQTKEIELLAFIGTVNRKLENEKFIQNANPEIIEKEKNKLATAHEDLNKLRALAHFFENA